jgi:hypothetical protein
MSRQDAGATRKNMSENVPKDVREGTDITAITQVILRERESRDMGRWETMRGCFWPDSLVRVSWFRGNGADFVTGSIDMANRGVRAKHRLGPVLVRIAGDRAVASLAGIIDLPAKLQGVDLTLSSHTRFLYRVERREQEWKIIGFDAIYLRDELTPAIPGQSVTIDANELKGFRGSYRLLSYYLKTQGFSIDSNLAGEDKPDTVEDLNRELFGWVGLKVPV